MTNQPTRTCRAFRQGDEMYCATCRLRWSVEDFTPETCMASPNVSVSNNVEAATGGSFRVLPSYKRPKYKSPFRR